MGPTVFTSRGLVRSGSYTKSISSSPSETELSARSSPLLTLRTRSLSPSPRAQVQRLTKTDSFAPPTGSAAWVLSASSRCSSSRSCLRTPAQSVRAPAQQAPLLQEVLQQHPLAHQRSISLEDEQLAEQPGFHTQTLSTQQLGSPTPSLAQ